MGVEAMVSFYTTKHSNPQLPSIPLSKWNEGKKRKFTHKVIHTGSGIEGEEK
jgi:hypothetical protein